MRQFVFLLVLLLSACGSEDTSVTLTPPVIYYSKPEAIDTFQPLNTAVVHHPLMDIYAKDLNNDGVDEVIVAGLRDASSSLITFNIQLYGWNTGAFANETNNWFDLGDNVVTGTSKVAFGDFDNDGNVDFALNADSDSTVVGETLVLFNDGDGTLTRTEHTVGTPWSHDLAVFDFNGDGADDFMVLDYGVDTVIYISNGDRTFTSFNLSDVKYSASGVSIADYQPGGEIDIVMTDNGPDEIKDTFMYTYDAGSLVDTTVDFPGSRYTQAQADLQTHSRAHAIRNSPMDFDNDGDLDVVVFERLDEESTVQFLRNDGGGLAFSDVSDTLLQNYETKAAASGYQPTIKDFNGDGLDDIYLSGISFNPDYDMTQVLLQSSDGKFVSNYIEIFNAFWSEIWSMTANNNPTGQNMQIVRGPNNEDYLASMVMSYKNGDFNSAFESTFYLSRLGIKSTRSPSTAVELQTADWPYIQ